jgi:hypothetical protein
MTLMGTLITLKKIRRVLSKIVVFISSLLIHKD